MSAVSPEAERGTRCTDGGGDEIIPKAASSPLPWEARTAVLSVPWRDVPHSVAQLAWRGPITLWDTISPFLLPAWQSSGLARQLSLARFQTSEWGMLQSFLCGTIAPWQFMALVTQAALRNYPITTARRASMSTWEFIKTEPKESMRLTKDVTVFWFH